MGKPNIKTTGFDDDSVTAGGYIERPEAFDPSTKGSTYHFRVLRPFRAGRGGDR
jgi:hypothetical protein